MHKYPLNEVPIDLEPWPFDNPASDYRILRGNPRASGRLDHGSCHKQDLLQIKTIHPDGK